MGEISSLDELAEIAAKEQEELMDALESDPAYQKRAEAKRQAQIENEIRQGIRDKNGDYIDIVDPADSEYE